MIRFLWFLFALFIVYGTTIPFDFSIDGEVVRQKLATLELNPLMSGGRRVSLPDTFQNILLFVPFGLLGSLAISQGSASRVWALVGATLASTTLSVGVEALQLVTHGRVTSTADVLTNTVGGFIGALLVIGSRDVTRHVFQQYRRSPWVSNRFAYPALCALVALIVAAWQPFDPTLDVGSVAAKVRGLLSSPFARGPLTDEGSAFVIYALATMALAAWMGEARRTPATGAAVAVVCGAAFALELSQLFVESRSPSPWDFGVRAAGSVVGGWLSSIDLLRHRTLLLGLLFTVSALGAAMSMLAPFEIAAVRQPFTWFPFRSHVAGSPFPAVSHIVELLLLYLPFGFALAWSFPQRRVMAVAAGGALVAAVVTEYAQTWTIGRYADITDVAFASLGAALGVWLGGRGAAEFERARSRPGGARDRR